MLHSLNHLLGSSVKCLNDEFGSLYNAYISEKTWRVGYFVIQTGSWLHDRRVLVAPAALRTPFWSDGLVYVDLTRQQILDSPPIDAAKPVSRQQEELMNAYFGWPAYWSPTDLPPPELARDEGPSTLRSLRELQGYTLAGSDGEVGTVVDLIGDEPCWDVPYLVIETGGLLSSKRFCPSRFVTEINWAERLVRVDLLAASVEESPDPPSSELPDALFAADVEKHYGSRGSRT
ncbi:MAG: hypothetical protein ABL995_17165 [Bryobacteraceae bacterium]